MGRTRRGQAVHGVLLLDKPVGLSSNLALQKARRLFDAQRAGHTGTLDPLASGLLVIGLGEATKFCGELLDADKSYEATLHLGVRTSTGDAEGEVLETRPVAVTREQLDAALVRFAGTIEQVPPMYSALKRDGRPLYDYARAGIEVERAPRRVTIHSLRVLDFRGDRALLQVDCSKGTYVRTLAEDIGAALGCGAHLAALRRTRVGSFAIGQAISLDALAVLEPERRIAFLREPEALVAALPAIVLDAESARRFGHGGSVPVAAARDVRVRVHDACGRLLGIGCIDAAGTLAPRRLMADAAPVPPVRAGEAVADLRRDALGKALEPEPASVG